MELLKSTLSLFLIVLFSAACEHPRGNNEPPGSGDNKKQSVSVKSEPDSEPKKKSVSAAHIYISIDRCLSAEFFGPPESLHEKARSWTSKIAGRQFGDDMTRLAQEFACVRFPDIRKQVLELVPEFFFDGVLVIAKRSRNIEDVDAAHAINQGAAALGLERLDSLLYYECDNPEWTENWKKQLDPSIRAKRLPAWIKSVSQRDTDYANFSAKFKDAIEMVNSFESENISKVLQAVKADAVEKRSFLDAARARMKNGSLPGLMAAMQALANGDEKSPAIERLVSEGFVAHIDVLLGTGYARYMSIDYADLWARYVIFGFRSVQEKVGELRSKYELAAAVNGGIQTEAAQGAVVDMAVSAVELEKALDSLNQSRRNMTTSFQQIVDLEAARVFRRGPELKTVYEYAQIHMLRDELLAPLKRDLSQWQSVDKFVDLESAQAQQIEEYAFACAGKPLKTVP